MYRKPVGIADVGEDDDDDDDDAYNNNHCSNSSSTLRSYPLSSYSQFKPIEDNSSSTSRRRVMSQSSSNTLFEPITDSCSSSARPSSNSQFKPSESAKTVRKRAPNLMNNDLPGDIEVVDATDEPAAKMLRSSQRKK